MKSGGILNRDLMRAISDMGHTQIMVIGDAGVPVPDSATRIDLALAEDIPTIQQVLKYIMEEMIYEKVIVAEEQKKNNPKHFEAVCTLSKRCKVETMPHEKLFSTYLPKAKYIIRTGSFEPFGNVVLQSGIDAPKWFAKEGCLVPGYYEERVEYKG